MARRRRAEQAAQPHDGLVRWAFSQREHAIGLLKAALPPELVAAVDFGTLVVVKDSFVHPSLRRSHSDLILEARMGGDRIYFYTVVEHQRNVQPLMVFRMLEYMVCLWARLLLDRPATRELPPLVRMQKQKLSALLQRAVSPAAKEVIVTFLDEIRLEGKREGKLEGKREGKLEGKREMLLKLLTARFGPLSEDLRAQLRSAGDATLEKWTLRVLTAPTLEAVLDGSTAKAAPARRPATGASSAGRSSRPSPRKRVQRPASGRSSKRAP